MQSVHQQPLPCYEWFKNILKKTGNRTDDGGEKTCY